MAEEPKETTEQTQPEDAEVVSADEVQQKILDSLDKFNHNIESFGQNVDALREEIRATHPSAETAAVDDKADDQQTEDPEQPEEPNEEDRKDNVDKISQALGL